MTTPTRSIDADLDRCREQIRDAEKRADILAVFALWNRVDTLLDRRNEARPCT